MSSISRHAFALYWSQIKGSKSFMYYFLRAWQWEVGYYLISLPKKIIITLISLVLLIPFNLGELQKKTAL